jgi:GT2 family glycosyltransferase
MKPRCSIIIPTYNTCSLTLDCLAEIKKNAPSGAYEIIVIDNNSSDGTFEQVRKQYPQVMALRNSSNLGFGRACNRGAQNAQGTYLLFLNSDTKPLQGTFDELLQWLEQHPKTGIVGPELVGPDFNLLQMSWGWNPLLGWEFIQQYFAPYSVRRSSFKRRLIRFLQRKPRHVPSICGACLMIRREAFDDIHQFDEDFELYFEDSDLCWRCVQAGWRIDFIPEAKLIHHLGQSTKGSWSMTSLIYQQSHITYYRKHAPRWAVYVLKFYLLLKWLRLKGISIVERKTRRQAKVYCDWYLSLILESMKINLNDRLGA